MTDITFTTTNYDDGFNLVLNGAAVARLTARAGTAKRTINLFEAAQTWIDDIVNSTDPAVSDGAKLRARILEESIAQQITLAFEVQATNVGETNNELVFTLTTPMGAATQHRTPRNRRPGIAGGIVFAITYGKSGAEVAEVESYDGPPTYLGIAI